MKPRVAIASLLLVLASIALSLRPLQVSDPSLGPPDCKPLAPLRIEVIDQVIDSGRLWVEYEVTPLIDASRVVVTPRLSAGGDLRVVRGVDQLDVSAGVTLRGALELRGASDVPFGIVATLDFPRLGGVERATREFWFREPTVVDPDLPRVEGSVATLEVPSIRVGGVR